MRNMPVSSSWATAGVAAVHVKISAAKKIFLFMRASLNAI